MLLPFVQFDRIKSCIRCFHLPPLTMVVNEKYSDKAPSLSAKNEKLNSLVGSELSTLLSAI